MNSFLKWPGGKRWFIGRYFNIFPSVYNRYIEPFLGSGSVFFYLEPKQSLLSDTNEELINLYNEMRDHPVELARLMIHHNGNHSSEYYYQIRGHKATSNLERAAQFLYLNRTCYNGMYRVNQKGEFNVPIGTKTKCDQDVDSFAEFSRLLKTATLCVCDFEKPILDASEGDLIFADPPYVVARRDGTFINYNDKLFSWDDQKRLLTLLFDARERGAYVISTNSYSPQIVDMYKHQGFYTTAISRSCVMAANSKKRGKIKELLITSYEIKNTEVS